MQTKKKFKSKPKQNMKHEFQLYHWQDFRYLLNILLFENYR